MKEFFNIMSKLKFVFFLLILLGFLFAFSSFAQTSTPDIQSIIKQLQDQIKLLNQQILDLQSRLKKTEEEVEIVKTELKFTRSLKRGESNDEVRQLQEFFKQFPDIYPEGLVTGFFGSLTETAVKRFQKKQGIESIGVVGPKTIQRLNEFSAGAIPATPAIPAIPGVSPAVPAIPASPSLPFQPASASQPIVIPAIPATPATPAVPGVSTAIPATPATPSQPSSSTLTPTPTISTSPSPTASVSATKTPTPTPSPTSILVAPIIHDFGFSSLGTVSDLSITGRFKYNRTADTKALNVYIKYPDQGTYIKYTYYQDMTKSWFYGPDSTELLINNFDFNGMLLWHWKGSGWRPVSFFPLGTYSFYAAALGTDDKEGPPSAVATATLFAAPTITNPVSGATLAFPITITLGQTLSGQYYRYTIYGDGLIYYDSAPTPYDSGYIQNTSITIDSTSRFLRSLVNGKTYQIYVQSGDNSSGTFSATKQPNAESKSFVFSVSTPTPTPTPTPAPTASVSFSPFNQASATANILDALKSILQTLSNLLSLIGQ